jgi:phage I-like protein
LVLIQRSTELPSTTAAPTVKTAALSFEIGAANAQGVVPSEAHLLPVGPFRAVDGRPWDCDAWLLDEVIAQRVIERMAGRGNDTLIDYEHQTLHKETNGQPNPAAGWFRSMEWRATDQAAGKAGLWAVSVGWTATAKTRIEAREYRYISAVFSYYPSTGEVLEVLYVALTNSPGLDGLDPLTESAALSRSIFATPPQRTERETMKPEEQIAALTAEVATLKPQAAQVVALTAQVAALTAQHATVVAERDTATAALTAHAAKAEKDKHTEMLTAALTDGRLAPAQKPWAEKQSLAALTEYLAATAPLLQDGRQLPAGNTDGGEGLSAIEIATCTRMGVAHKDFLAAKQSNAA